jgi:hypothetical protein
VGAAGPFVPVLRDRRDRGPAAGAHAGSVSYGPALNAAAVVLTSYGNVSPERAGHVVDMLLGVRVSAGWVDKADARLSGQLEQAGFDAAMCAALAAEPVLATRPTSGCCPGWPACSSAASTSSGGAAPSRNSAPAACSPGADVISILREAHQAVEEARARRDTALDPEQLAKLRQRYDQAAAFGITHNRLRDWHDGNHPGYALGCWLQEYKEQVWLFTREFAVEWTSNSAERAVKGPKRHQAVSGYWHTQRTLARWCRIRSYLDSARNHGLRALDAIRAALKGKPWLPPLPAPP